VLVAANLAATVLRFVLLREWVFAARRSTTRPLLEATR
jgi:putative flippase GtrA